MHDGVERMADVTGVPEAMELAEAASKQIDTQLDVPEVATVVAT